MASAAGVWPCVRSNPQCWYIPLRLRRLERYCSFDKNPGTAFTEFRKSSNAFSKVIFVLFSEIGTSRTRMSQTDNLSTLCHCAGRHPADVPPAQSASAPGGYSAMAKRAIRILLLMGLLLSTCPILVHAD